MINSGHVKPFFSSLTNFSTSQPSSSSCYRAFSKVDHVHWETRAQNPKLIHVLNQVWEIMKLCWTPYIQDQICTLILMKKQNRVRNQLFKYSFSTSVTNQRQAYSTSRTKLEMLNIYHENGNEKNSDSKVLRPGCVCSRPHLQVLVFFFYKKMIII